MATEQRLTLSFDGANVADANRFAAELAVQLREAEEPMDVQETRADRTAQDFGATLVLVLGAPAVVALAKGIAAWLAMRPDARITIKGENGTVIASGLTSADARAVIEKRLGKGD